jgi:ATP-binding cassette subfamily C protein
MAFVLVRTVSMFGKAQERYQEAVSAESAYWSLRSLIDEAADHKEIAEGTLKPGFERACVFETVSFAHDERTVLDAVSLRVETGVVTVLTGISGAGKTTIVDLLAGLLKPASGRILVDDRLLAELDLPAWRRMIGYVPQEVRLFNDTILANVTLERPGTTREEAIEALKEAHAWRFIAPLPNGVDSEVGERGSLFSGGERQRIALARALLGRPRLLILDEATSALDGEAEIELCRALADLCHRHGFAILAIAHRPAWLRVADRVYTLAGGKLKEQTAPPRELAS